MNVAYHELINGSTLMIDPNRDVNEVCAIILAGKQNGCVILGGGSPKNFYLQGQPTLWEVYGIPKGGNDYFIQITTDQVVWGGLSGRHACGSGQLGQGQSRRPARYRRRLLRFDDRLPAVLRVCGRFAERAPRSAELVHKRDELVADLCGGEARRRSRARSRHVRASGDRPAR